ncbi:MAG TPA: Gfo/Idh/MocA family oxidoreductase [Chitinophagaceae bacterium]|nr:Gfo/Idh/MocA family oxidoreductase [Chitinophagaceae bacterium]
MNSNRRDFLRLTSLTGLGLLSTSLAKGATENVKEEELKKYLYSNSHKQHFNMSGYSAPKLDTVRVGFIGLGMRGPTHLNAVTKLEGVEVKGVCDIRREHAESAYKMAKDAGHDPKVYTDKADAWKRMCDSGDLDLVFIASPWDLHTPMALYAMEHDIHVCCEVPIGLTLEECWQVVETSEKTKKHCMMMENCCYDFFELLTLNMARQGYFGEVMHGEGAYNHNLYDLNFNKNGYYGMWRLRENTRHNGNLYPTHGLGPICQIMNMNRGDKMEYLVSVSTNDFMMGERAKEYAAKDSFFAPYVGAQYRGNMNVTTVRTHKGKTIMIEHDVTSPNVYSRIHKVVGTEGTALKYPLPGKISNGGHHWIDEKEMEEVKKKYAVPIVEKVGKMAKKVGGHGGMDFMMDWRTIDCLRNGLPLDQDVYDAALWSCIFPLSGLSVANKAMTLDIPDFTRGSWKTNAPVDLSLKEGANTGVKG